MPVPFPSVEFFQALRQQMLIEHERFSRLGYFDSTFGIRVRSQALAEGRADFVLHFEVFECVEARASRDVTEEKLDFVLDGELEAWEEMLRNIKEHGAADSEHSINTLTHFGEGLKLLYDDPDGHDKLYRFAESVQEFFDLSSRLEIEFPGSGAAAERP